MINSLQIVAITFSLTLIYFAILNSKRGEIESLEAYIWSGIWAITILIVLFPDVIRTFAQTVFISRLFDLLVVGGFILVITMVYKAYIKVKKMEKKMEEYVRKESLGEAEKKKKLH